MSATLIVEEDTGTAFEEPTTLVTTRRGAEHKYLIAVAVVLAALMQVIDSSIVNVALPDMMGNLGANLDEIAWVTTGYILANVIVIPLTGWLGAFFGRTRYFVASVALFTIASFFCGAAHSLGTLILWRIVQGVGVGALQYLLEHGQRDDWFDSPFMTALAVIGIVGGVLLIWREMTTEHPVIDFRVLRHRQMWVGTVLGIVMGVGLYASVFTLPVFLQGNLRMTAQQTGIILLPGALATAVSMAIVGRLTNKFDPRLLITIGALLFAGAMIRLSRITGESGSFDFFWSLIMRGIGLGMMFVPLTTVTLAELDHRELPQGTGLYNFFRQLGGSLGIAAIATLLSHYTAQFRAILAEHISYGDPTTMSRVDMLTRGLMSRGADAWTARARALEILDRELMGQASVVAYSRIYVLSAVITLALIPLLLLIRHTRGAAGSH